jgi:hypothetical protein
LCKLFNYYKGLFIRLAEIDRTSLTDADRLKLHLIERFALTNMVKLNQIITPFISLSKDNQAYINPATHMSTDTEPRRYSSIMHFFANYYNQMMHILLGYPDPKALE